MHLKDEQINRLGEKILNDLSTAGQILLKKDRGAALNAVKAAIAADLQAEAALDRDTERVLTENLAALGRGAAEIDRQKMFRMIKAKLAKDRNMVL